MKVSYNWLKSYIPKIPPPTKLADIFTYHICEVEGVEKGEADTIFDLNILPNRAHDLLSHRGVARELASLLDIKFTDPTSKYKIPEAKSTNLKITINSEKCRRYVGRIVRGVKIGPSPDWVVKHLASIGQRSINNIIDATNIVMFDCGQPVHAFDLDKVNGGIVIRGAKNDEVITTLDNKTFKLKPVDMVIADSRSVLALAGIKGGKKSEVDGQTENLILEVANFDPTSVRKTAQSLNLLTDAKKRFENDLSPELVSYAMPVLSALILEMCPDAIFEDMVDVYTQKQEKRKLVFSAERISSILGLKVSNKEIENILKRYIFEYVFKKGVFEIKVPAERLDLVMAEDMAEEIGRILRYDKVKPKIPELNFKPKTNQIYQKISWARNELLQEGYSEVMTYAFRDQGEIEVMKSASDKKFLRTNLADGLKESQNINNINFFLFGKHDVKIFEIGTVWCPKEEIHVAYFNIDDKDFNFKPEEISLDDFCNDMPSKFYLKPKVRNLDKKFQMWSLFPFIVRDIAVWMSEGADVEKLKKILIKNGTNLLAKEPYLFDSFSKGGKSSYAFRLIFQSFDRTLTDTEVNEIMTKITNKIKANNTWQVR